MEPFAIWNLLKTVLSSAETPSAAPNAPTREEEKTVEIPKEEPPKESPARANACEAYFLRHEQIKSQRKR